VLARVCAESASPTLNPARIGGFGALVAALWTLERTRLRIASLRERDELRARVRPLRPTPVAPIAATASWGPATLRTLGSGAETLQHALFGAMATTALLGVPPTRLSAPEWAGLLILAGLYRMNRDLCVALRRAQPAPRRTQDPN
jgi:hypothetical protein